MQDRELMQMALDALMTCREDWIFDGEDERPVDTYDEKMVSAAFKALCARLAQPEPEPFAYIDHRIHGWPDCFVMQADPPHTSPLYTAPPQRE